MPNSDVDSSDEDPTSTPSDTISLISTTPTEIEFKFGVEIEFVARPRRPRRNVKVHYYYRKLALAMGKQGLQAECDDGSERYRKHSELYDESWWITKDGSLSPDHGEVPVEAVSHTLKSKDEWWDVLNLFWKAQNNIFRMPRRSKHCGFHIHITPISGCADGEWTLSNLKNIAIGILFYEDLIQAMLPAFRRDHVYCQRNSKNSTAIKATFREAKHHYKSDISSREHCMGYVRDEIEDFESIADIVKYMQDDRRVIWNFANLVPRNGKKATGTIEFRGGRCLRGPVRTRWWVEFALGVVNLMLDKRMYWEDFPTYPSIDQLYSEIREAANEVCDTRFLPTDYRVFNETRQQNSPEADDSRYDSDVSSVRSSGAPIDSDYDYDTTAEDSS